MKNTQPSGNTTLHISLPSGLKKRVEERIQNSGTYSNASDYVRSLIRADIEHLVEDRLESLLLAGIASGKSKPLDIKQIKEKGYKKARARV